MLATRVFIFESDNLYARELERAFLERGAVPTVFEDAQMGIAAMGQDAPELCIISAELTKMSGFSVCNRIKKEGNTAHTSVVMVSSEAGDETFEQHRRLRTRAEAYVHKPMAAEELATRSLALLEVELDAEAFHVDDVTDVIAKEARPSRVGFNIDFSTDSPPESAAAWASPSAAPPPPPSRASLPAVPRPVDPGPAALREANFASLQRLNSELAERLRKLELERDKWVRDSDEFRARGPSPSQRPPAPAPSVTREILEAREALHKKDVELLSVREQLAAKDREVLHLSEQLIAGDRAKLLTDESISVAEERAHVLSRDLENAKRHGDAELARLASERDAAVVAVSELEQRMRGLASEHEVQSALMLAELTQVHAEHNDLRAQAKALLSALSGAQNAAHGLASALEETAPSERLPSA